MTNDQKQVKEMMQMYLQDTPERPLIPSLEVRKRCAKLILEEALETIASLGFDSKVWAKEEQIGVNLHDLQTEFILEDNLGPNLTEIADGCEDLKVVTEGCLIACGLACRKEGIKTVSRQVYANGKEGPEYIHFTGHEDPLFNEVMRSNQTKFWKYSELGLAEKQGHKIQLVNTPENPKTEFSKVGEVHVATMIPDYNVKCYVVTDKDGKFIKSPSYSPPNLAPIIEEMSK